MAIAVEMPKMTDTMEEGILVEWTVREGAAIAAGDVIAQVETDKAMMDVEAYDDGVLLKKVAREGEALPIGGLIAVLGKAGEDPSTVLAEYDGAVPTATTAKDEAAQLAPAVASQPTPQAAPISIKASPLARRMAADHGLDLKTLAGSGPEGRVIKRDIVAAMSAVPARGYKALRVTQMRKTIARRLAESKFTAPHFYLTVDVKMERAIHVRTALNERGEGKISYNDLVTKAAATALTLYPAVNSSWADTEIRHHAHVDIGIAVAIGHGLVTPVVRNADRKNFFEIARETAVLAGKARSGQLQPADMADSTFTTSNLGMFGIEEFTAIINPPNAAILAIGAIRDEAVVEGGTIKAGKRMKITLSCDHRVVDGATGAQFLSALKGFLEEPVTMFL